MAVDTSVIGKPTGAAKVIVERGPVSYFASSLKDENPVFHDAGAARAAVALLNRLGYRATLKVIPNAYAYFHQISDSRIRAQAGMLRWTRR